jgi:hypothetical protein
MKSDGCVGLGGLRPKKVIRRSGSLERREMRLRVLRAAVRLWFVIRSAAYADRGAPPDAPLTAQASATTHPRSVQPRKKLTT